MMEAINKAWTLGINPGGEVQGVVAESIPDDCVNRLLGKAEILERGLGQRVTGDPNANR